MTEAEHRNRIEISRGLQFWQCTELTPESHSIQLDRSPKCSCDLQLAVIIRISKKLRNTSWLSRLRWARTRQSHKAGTIGIACLTTVRRLSVLPTKRGRKFLVRFPSTIVDRVLVLVANRLCRPGSEHALAQWLESDFVCGRDGKRILAPWKQQGRVRVD